MMAISGDGGDNHLIGGDGVPPGADDDIFGLGGDDLLEGLGGDDRLYGGDGADVLIGGNDHDELYGGAGDDLLNGGGGTHTQFISHPGQQPNPTEVLDGGAGNDTMVMHYANYVLTDAPDKALAFALDITTGASQAVVTFGPHSAAQKAESFTSIEALDFSGPEGSDDIHGGALADTILGNGGNDTLYGGAGNDLIGDSSGRIKADGGDGIDTLQLVRTDTLAISVVAAQGSLVVGGISAGRFVHFENLILSTGIGDDTITGFVNGTNILSGAAGNDQITGGALADQLYGGGGDDLLTGGNGADDMDGGTGNNTLYGGAGNDTLGVSGGGALDHLYGGAGNDLLLIDLTTVQAGASYDGGTGHDILITRAFDTATHDLTGVSLAGVERLEDGQGFFGSGFVVRLTVAEVEQVTSISYANDGIAFADNAAAVLAGDITVRNLYLADGGQSLDLTGLTGRVSQIYGGGGNDTVKGYYGATVQLGLGNDSFAGDLGGDVVYGGTGNDTLRAGAAGQDFSGDDGRDLLFGALARDTLLGGLGGDRLYGGGGDDRLTGGQGHDSLHGGAGSDTFIYTSPTEGGDVIFGLEVGDRLAFQSGAFGSVPLGALDPSMFVARPDTQAQDSNDHFILRTTDHTLWYDANGSASGGLTEISAFSGGTELTAGNILLI